ncbi:recombinase family protein [Halorubrum ezzemoulense]|uniref:recombinase family protein n=1 Tax=Halorubrum ezzemoulense TaxID=337243 RepID=UPI00232ED963|nr:recombinase family protein [Halorubrum ezzemoulense]MDB2226162.1 recombinase family protein [Halorubrum ezzemoulense]
MVAADTTAVYIRWSTAEQERDHQESSISEWLAEHDLAIGAVDVYAEQASGASRERDEFNELVDAIDAGAYADVVVWELSRIARKGVMAQRFLDTAEDAGTTIHVTNGSVRKIEPDGHGRMVADVISAVAAEERRSLIRRTEAGIDRAKSEGKWIGQVPAGFVRVDGYLRPNFAPDYDADETGFHDIADALEQIDSGESYRAVATATPNVTRQTLMRIDGDDERRGWYLDGEANDEAVAKALNDTEGAADD